MRLSFTFILFFQSLFLFAQENSNNMNIYLEGRLEDPKKELKIGNNLIQVSSDGTFQHKLFMNESSFLDLFYGNKKFNIFLCPSDSLYISLNTSNISFSGTGEELNSFLQKYEILISQNEQYLEENHQKIFAVNKKDFEAQIDSLETTEKRLINEFLNKNPNTDSIFANRIKTAITYKHKRYRLLYPNNFHRYSNLKKQADVPNNYFEKIMQNSFDNPNLLQSQQYIRCVNYYFDILSAGEYKFCHLEYVPFNRIDARYDAIIELEAKQEIKDFFIKEHFNSNIWIYRVEALEYSYEKALLDVKNEAYLEEIKNLYRMGFERRTEANEIKKYRTINNIELYAHIFFPENYTKNESKPVHLFFHGGGWAIGLPEWSYNACKDAIKNGRVAITFDYRLRNIHGTDIKASVSDALTAIAWVRENAEALGINPNKVLVEGFSAGGHLALVAAMIDNPEDFGVFSSFSSKPDAIILGSTPYDIAGRDVYNIDYDTKIISPLYLISNDLPPILSFHGEADNIVNFSEFEKFREAMSVTNNDFTYGSYPNANHFFNGGTKEDSEERRKLEKEFLIKNGF